MLHRKGGGVVQKERGSKYKIEVAYIQRGESRELPEECELVISENGKARRCGASSIRIKAATNAILIEQMKAVMQAIEKGHDVQIIDTRGK